MLFCSDLDNTLIHSYRHQPPAGVVWVERLDGKKLSFISQEGMALLRQIAAKGIFVPVTTRSLQQYSRIDFGAEVLVPYALVANGGILLKNGVLDPTWMKISKALADEVADELEKGRGLLKKDPNTCFEVRKVDDLFIFTKSQNTEQTLDKLKAELNFDKIFIEQHGTKVYLFPRGLTKGSALKRLRCYLGAAAPVIAAGDSNFDISMLEEADVGLCPAGLYQSSKSSVITFAQLSFTEAMLNYVVTITNNNWKKEQKTFS